MIGSRRLGSLVGVCPDAGLNLAPGSYDITLT
jgi:hypothetical protein